MSKFLDEFKERGFFHQATDLEELSKLDSTTAYIGFDCTASSLHVGSLMQIMILRLLKKTGNKPIILLGGGTTKVGDPSGKDESRKLLTSEDIEKHKQGIRKVFEKFGLGDATIVDNSEWLDKLNYLEFLRDYGRFFSVNRMLSFDSVKLRLEREQNLSFLEFNYMILQAYDFVRLNNIYGCRVQIGGSDQWGNIVNGTELARKIGVKEDLFGLTTPLITTSSGAKMGKTADGAVWLDENLVSPFHYFQFWRNTSDADVIKFLKYFTELPMAEIEKMAKWQGQELNEAKKILAYEATKLCHGQSEADKALEAVVKTFEQGGSEGLPEVVISDKELPAYQLFQKAGLAKSGGEARRLIQGGGAKLNDEKIADENQMIQIKDGSKLSAGKKNHVIIKIS